MERTCFRYTELTHLENMDSSEHIPLPIDRHFTPGTSSLQEKSKVHRQIELCKKRPRTETSKLGKILTSKFTLCISFDIFVTYHGVRVVRERMESWKGQ